MTHEQPRPDDPAQSQQFDPYAGPPPGMVPGPVPAPDRRPLLLAGAAVLAVLLLSTVGLVVYEGFFKEDSGVAACRAMAEQSNPEDVSVDDEDLTEAEYRELREQFADSRHQGIRTHGTALIDIVWQVSRMPEGEKAGALAFIGPMGTHISGLQTACADQGVILDLDSD